MYRSHLEAVHAGLASSRPAPQYYALARGSGRQSQRQIGASRAGWPQPEGRMQCRRSLLARHANHLNPRCAKQNRARSCRSGVIRSDACFLGLDFGTSGGRASVIDGEHDALWHCCWCQVGSCCCLWHAEFGKVVTEAKQAYGLVRDGKGWQDCLEGLMAVLPREVRSRIQVSGHCHAGPSRLCLACCAPQFSSFCAGSCCGWDIFHCAAGGCQHLGLSGGCQNVL